MSCIRPSRGSVGIVVSSCDAATTSPRTPFRVGRSGRVLVPCSYDPCSIYTIRVLCSCSCSSSVRVPGRCSPYSIPSSRLFCVACPSSRFSRLPSRRGVPQTRRFASLQLHAPLQEHFVHPHLHLFQHATTSPRRCTQTATALLPPSVLIP